MVKYSRLFKKKENEKVKIEVGKEVVVVWWKQYFFFFQYYCVFNVLQYRKWMVMMEFMIGFVYGQINFFKKGVEMFFKYMDSFLFFVVDMV